MANRQKWYNYEVEIKAEVIVGEDSDAESISKEFKDINDERAAADAGDFVYQIMKADLNHRILICTLIRKEGKDNILIESPLLKLMVRSLNKYNEDLSKALSNAEAWKARAQKLKNDLDDEKEDKTAA